MKDKLWSFPWCVQMQMELFSQQNKLLDYNKPFLFIDNDERIPLPYYHHKIPGLTDIALCGVLQISSGKYIQNIMETAVIYFFCVTELTMTLILILYLIIYSSYSYRLISLINVYHQTWELFHNQRLAAIICIFKNYWIYLMIREVSTG